MFIGLVFVALLAQYGLVAVEACKCNELPSEGHVKEPQIVQMLKSLEPTHNTNDQSRPACRKTEASEINNKVNMFLTNLVDQGQSMVSTVSAGYLNVLNQLLVPSSANSKSCYESVLQHLGDYIFKQKIAKEAFAALRGYADDLDIVARDQKLYCKRCNEKKQKEHRLRGAAQCVETCDNRYVTRLQTFYDKIRDDRVKLGKASYRSEIWTVYYRKELCTLQFLVAAEMASVAKSTDPVNFNVFANRLIPEDAFECLHATAVAIDDAVRDTTNNALPVMLRAFVIKDVQPWMDDFQRLANTTQIAIASGGDGRLLTENVDVMLFDSTQGWLSFDESESWCTSSSNCPANGPGYMERSKENEAWTKCKSSVFKITKVKQLLPQNNNDQTEQDAAIRVNDLVQIVSKSQAKVFWDLVDMKYDKAGTKECLTPYLKFGINGESKAAKADGHTSLFYIQAWDWTGRKRNKDETIYDRDWVVFNYFQAPEAAKLKLDPPGYHFIEGIVAVDGLE